VNGQNRINFIRNSGHIVIRDPNFKYFSLIAADEKVKGVSVEGAKYPLKNKTLSRCVQFAVSNEIVKNAALITVKKGGVYIIESRDI
jgi:thiamine pyrophosphokinase